MNYINYINYRGLLMPVIINFRNHMNYINCINYRGVLLPLIINLMNFINYMNYINYRNKITFFYHELQWVLLPLIPDFRDY